MLTPILTIVMVNIGVNDIFPLYAERQQIPLSLLHKK